MLKPNGRPRHVFLQHQWQGSKQRDKIRYQREKLVPRRPSTLDRIRDALIGKGSWMGKQKGQREPRETGGHSSMPKGFFFVWRRVGFGTVPLLPVTVGSEAWVSNSAVGSGGMGWRGGVVDGGGVVGASGGGDRQTHTHIYAQTKRNTTKKISSQVGNHSFTEEKH